MQMFREGGPREHAAAVHPLKKQKQNNRTRPTLQVVQVNVHSAAQTDYLQSLNLTLTHLIPKRVSS